MAFYPNMRNIAKNLLTKYGNPFELKKPDGEAKYNSKTKKTEQMFKSYAGICVMKPYSAETIGMLSNIINAGDVEFVCQMDDKSVVPVESKDKIIFGGQTYNIINVTTINPDGSLILVFKIQCRRVSNSQKGE